MLKTLRLIVEEVNAARSLTEILKIIVERVGHWMKADAVSVYLVHQKRSCLVLMAAEPHDDKTVGHFSLGLKEGIIGLVGERGESINLENAKDHPRFHSVKALKEERYRAMVAVPIIHHRKLLGVLVVQQFKSRRFDEGEEAFLVTISAQLAGTIAHAEATGAIEQLAHFHNKSPYQETVLDGIAGSPGIAVGKAVVVDPLADLNAIPNRQADNPKEEIRKFQKALNATRRSMRVFASQLSSALAPEERALFEAFEGILSSESLGKEVTVEIKKGNWAPGALCTVVRSHVAIFKGMGDEYLRERASDIKDLGQRVLAHLLEQRTQLPDFIDESILVGEEVTASMLAEAPAGKLAGIISVKGSSNSHVAILARAMGIPTVMGVVDLPVAEVDGKNFIIDGHLGHVYLTPSDAKQQEYRRLAQAERQFSDELLKIREFPASTTDNHHLALFVNTGLADDIGPSINAGAEGVGLYRTEVLFMRSDRFPGEDEQRRHYRHLLKAFHPKPVTMRTLDVGGDKALPYFPIKEDNPFLGWRGIRITLDHPELFLVQAKAMLKASLGLNNLQIMFPMVSVVDEVDEALRLMQQAYRETLDEGFDIQLPKIGVMIEVPAAAYQVPELSKQVDFLSVGSNDLTQYILAVDRNNPRVASLYNALHPAVLKALLQIAAGARLEKKPISICGELAGDPAAAILLMAMGYETLSMNVTSLLRVKSAIRAFSMRQAKELLAEVMSLPTAGKIRKHLDLALQQAGVGELIRVTSR